MVLTDQSDILSQGEVESPFQPAGQKQPEDHNLLASLGRQSSIYSLTLDEFQHTLSDGGKNFGSMNMDEFLNSIWTAEENQTHAHSQATNPNMDVSAAVTRATANINCQVTQGEISAPKEKSIVKQPSLPRQVSLTLPAPLCRKTVEEVWSEIHRAQAGQQHSTCNIQNTGSTPRQPTFGEMTLEDFLVKAGVVREQGHPPPPPAPAKMSLPNPQQPFRLYQNSNNTALGPSLMARPVMAIGGGGGGVGAQAFPAIPHSSVGDTSANFVSGGKRSAGGFELPVISYSGRITNGSSGGTYGQVQGLGMGLPVSPVSSDGMGKSQVDGASKYGLDMSGIRGGRKRIIDGPVEKVVERRQRRMIKNRESAARSRARKQAYTVELEAELNQLKEENAQLREALKELESKLDQQYFEEANMKVQTKAEKAKDRLILMRRNMSCPY